MAKVRRRCDERSWRVQRFERFAYITGKERLFVEERTVRAKRCNRCRFESVDVLCRDCRDQLHSGAAENLRRREFGVASQRAPGFRMRLRLTGRARRKSKRDRAIA